MKTDSIVSRLMEVIPDYLRIHHKGKKKAVSLWRIIHTYRFHTPKSKYFILSYASAVEFCDAVHNLRAQGILIGSNHRGYYWITTPEEAADTIRYLEQPAKKRFLSAKGLRRGVMDRWNVKIEGV